MTKADYIAKLKANNRPLNRPDAVFRMRVEELLRIIELAYDAGHDEGKHWGDGERVFNQLFGGCGPRR